MHADYVKGTPINESFMERWLIMPKLLYFLLNMFVYAFHYMMPIFFMEEWKLKEHEFSYVTTITCVNFFGSMVWSSLADRTGRYKTIIAVCSVIYATIACALAYPVLMEEHQRVWRLAYMTTGLSMAFFFLTAAFPLLDAQVLGMLAANPNLSKEAFGRQRMFGAFGHFAASFLSTWCYAKSEEYGYKAYGQFVFVVFATLLFVPAVIFGVPDVKPVKGGHHGHHGSSNEKGKDGHAAPAASKNPILTLLSSPSFLLFMGVILSAGILRSAMTNFQSYYVQKYGKLEKVTSLIAHVTRTLSEVLVYWFSKDLNRWLGFYWVLVLSQAAGIFRILGYALMDPSSSKGLLTACFLECFKGLNSGLISSSAIRIANEISPPGCESTAQGLYSGNYTGLSAAVGGIVGGILIQIQEDPTTALRGMFLYVGLGTSVVTVLFACKYIFIDRVMGLPGFPRRRSSPGH